MRLQEIPDYLKKKVRRKSWANREYYIIFNGLCWLDTGADIDEATRLVYRQCLLDDWEEFKDPEKEYDKPSMEKLEEASKPLIKYIAENYDPHVKVIVDYNSAEVFSGEMSYRTKEFIRD